MCSSRSPKRGSILRTLLAWRRTCSTRSPPAGISIEIISTSSIRDRGCKATIRTPPQQEQNLVLKTVRFNSPTHARARAPRGRAHPAPCCRRQGRVDVAEVVLGPRGLDSAALGPARRDYAARRRCTNSSGHRIAQFAHGIRVKVSNRQRVGANVVPHVAKATGVSWGLKTRSSVVSGGHAAVLHSLMRPPSSSCCVEIPWVPKTRSRLQTKPTRGGRLTSRARLERSVAKAGTIWYARAPTYQGSSAGRAARGNGVDLVDEPPGKDRQVAGDREEEALTVSLTS